MLKDAGYGGTVYGRCRIMHFTLYLFTNISLAVYIWKNKTSKDFPEVICDQSEHEQICLLPEMLFFPVSRGRGEENKANIYISIYIKVFCTLYFTLLYLLYFVNSAVNHLWNCSHSSYTLHRCIFYLLWIKSCNCVLENMFLLSNNCKL